MKTPNEHDRIDAYKASSEDVQRLYASTVVGEVVANVLNSENTGTKTQHCAAVDSVGDVILGLYSKKDLPLLLQERANLSEEDAHALTEKLADLLAPLPDKRQHAGEREDSPEQIEFRPEGVAGGKEDATEAKAERPITREELASYLKPKHTMHDDVAAIQGSAPEEPEQQTEPSTEEDAKVEEKPADTPTDIPQKPAHDAAIPRYARPLTDTPKYGEDDA